MSTKTILKDDGVFVYGDYYLGKAAQRISEITPEIPAQNIRRHGDGSEVKAVLVDGRVYPNENGWYVEKLAGFANAVPFKQIVETQTDDFLGANLSTMIDYIQGHAQTKKHIKTVSEKGMTTQGFKTYEIIRSSPWYEDASPVIPFEESSKKSGNPVAYLIHPKLYALLSTVAPVDTVFAGTGTGTLTATLSPFGAVVETITLVATDPTHFTVTGSVSLLLGTAVVGTTFVCAQGEFLLEGTFIAGDTFTVTSYDAGL